MDCGPAAGIMEIQCKSLIWVVVGGGLQWESWERSGSLGAIAANTPTPFTLSWDHVAQSLTLAVDIADDSSAERSLGTGSVSYTWANGDSAAPAKDTFGTVNTFGVWPQAVTGGGHDAKFYLDDVTYTVPEPATATLLLLSILGMFAIRRRR